jgi:hypothetical protein
MVTGHWCSKAQEEESLISPSFIFLKKDWGLTLGTKVPCYDVPGLPVIYSIASG